jgi:hypothetical protein
MKLKHFILIYGTLVQVRAGFYTGCKGVVLEKYHENYGVNIRCKLLGAEKYIGLTTLLPKELKEISEKEYK